MAMSDRTAGKLRCSLVMMPSNVMKYRVMLWLLEKALRHRAMGSTSSFPCCCRSEPVGEKDEMRRRSLAKLRMMLLSMSRWTTESSSK